MKRFAAGLAAAAIAVFAFLVAEQSGAVSIRELLGLEPAESEKSAAAGEDQGKADGSATDTNWGKPDRETGDVEVKFDDIQKVLELTASERRQKVLGDEETFRRFVKSESDNLSVLNAARANNVQRDANTVFLMRRSAENILRESYLSRLFASKIPADFPSEQQLKDYYEKNKEKFSVGERVYIWQIYLPFGDAKDPKARQKQAEDIVRELNAGKIDFSRAAWKYSGHEASRRAGGYMGLVKVADLKPEVREPILALAEGKFSNPLTGEDGVHIFKRGARVPPEQLAFPDIKDQIRELLISQAQAQLRKAIYDQARQTYPVTLPDSKIEEWRLRLRTNVPAAGAPAAAPAKAQPGK